MADANTEVTLDGLHAAIRAAIVAAFPSFVTVELYRDDEMEGMPTPACLLEMTEFDPAPADDAGTGQFPALARIEARVIMSARKPAAKQEVRKAAVSLAAWLYLRRFPGASTDPAAIVSVQPDEFAPHVDKFETWSVEFVIPALFGEPVWQNDGTVPNAFYSFVPEIGAAHVAAYTQLDNEESP